MTIRNALRRELLLEPRSLARGLNLIERYDRKFYYMRNLFRAFPRAHRLA